MRASVKIGVVELVEESPGYNVEKETVRLYKVDLTRPRRRWYNSDYKNDDLRFESNVSLVPDSYFRRTPLHYFKWVEIHGTKWKIESVDIGDGKTYTLTLGGVWNG